MLKFLDFSDRQALFYKIFEITNQEAHVAPFLFD